MVLSDIDQFLLRSHDGRLGTSPNLPIPPLVLTLLSSAVSGSREAPVLTISLRIRNDGGVSYLFPISIDPRRAAVLPGQKGRRSMMFSLTLRTASLKEELITQPLITEGSETFPNSLVELKPGAAIVVKFNASAAGTVNWPTTGRTINVQVRVGLRESIQEDSGDIYISKSISGEVLSQNVVDQLIPR
jgi:hypothetical protein